MLEHEAAYPAGNIDPKVRVTQIAVTAAMVSMVDGPETALTASPLFHLPM
jgi:hypothetical protein